MKESRLSLETKELQDKLNIPKAKDIRPKTTITTKVMIKIRGIIFINIDNEKTLPTDTTTESRAVWKKVKSNIFE